ncbi:uncharacterized protein CC84DRAFT_419433 [Paraphaeosphaeria sporulosa]|uniref:Uncharacterized protein n=1 Tax=Paraphaeosphaeria sporulosa TaxID=1460663 RepID=A0A177BXA7_9PLEO|nr:uncharacterized protein CC84DRAFT_419433 [Paraphaeosphaeria sporulosa]OAF99147.1 hypothetical protein CC84DRAFT_419433 [Paraphaeosphaeria sporulosa]
MCVRLPLPCAVAKTHPLDGPSTRRQRRHSGPASTWLCSGPNVPAERSTAPAAARARAPPPPPAQWRPRPRRADHVVDRHKRAAGGCRPPSSFKCTRRFAELARGLIEPRPLGRFHACIACRVHEPRLPSPCSFPRALARLSLSDRSFLRFRLHSHSFRVLASPPADVPRSPSSPFPRSLLPFTPGRILSPVCVLARLGRQPFCLSFAAP